MQTFHDTSVNHRASASNTSDHAPSYYAASVNRELSFEPLQGEQRADVCIVGGGFSGLNTAIELAERGLSVILLEAHCIGWGASGRNGGQLIRGVGHDVEQFTNILGEEGVDELKRMGFEAVEIVRQRIERYAIDCDLTRGYCDRQPSRVISRASTKTIPTCCAWVIRIRCNGYRDRTWPP